MNLKERFIFAAIFVIALLTAYLTFPWFQSLLLPETDPLWEPLVEPRIAASIAVGFVGIWVILVIVNRLKYARNIGVPVVPSVVWALLLAVLGTAIAAFLSLMAFVTTAEALTTLGVPSLIAVAFGLLIAIIIFKFLCFRGLESANN